MIFNTLANRLIILFVAIFIYRFRMKLIQHGHTQPYKLTDWEPQIYNTFIECTQNTHTHTHIKATTHPIIWAASLLVHQIEAIQLLLFRLRWTTRMQFVGYRFVSINQAIWRAIGVESNSSVLNQNTSKWLSSSVLSVWSKSTTLQIISF